MIDSAEILSFIHESKDDYVSDVRVRPSDQALLIYVPRDKIAAKVKPGYTSLRQIHNLRKKIEEKFSVTALIVQETSSSHQELELGFGQLINRKFDGRILSFFMSFRDESLVDAWIEVSGLDDALRNEITDHIDTLFKELSLSIGELFWLNSPADLPTAPALMRLVKAYQPVTSDDLLSILAVDYPSINERWLIHRLDYFRKNGLLIWQKPGNYALTAHGVNVVPAGMGRSSSDIHRALALGRRKWWNA